MVLYSIEEEGEKNSHDEHVHGCLGSPVGRVIGQRTEGATPAARSPASDKIVYLLLPQYTDL